MNVPIVSMRCIEFSLGQLKDALRTKIKRAFLSKVL